jgi:hypothetical protein
MAAAVATFFSDLPVQAADINLVAGALGAPRAPARPVAQRDRA